MLKEFKEFALRGNVMDMAVGVVIGGAFGKIVTSLVQDIMMPIFGLLTAGMDFARLKIVLSPAGINEAGEEVAETAIMYGNFIQTTVDFIIIAASIFIAIKMINKLRRKQEAVEEEAAPAGPTEAELLTEIRDLLKEK
ncbi:MAG: large-conductance mechanosensitive channel protein MscL [Bacillota bacterium]|jgi:large conductance mechanosensitive channel|nr:large-conductance mechanosensitive channel protein MscL [Bacillota bacterium]